MSILENENFEISKDLNVSEIEIILLKQETELELSNIELQAKEADIKLEQQIQRKI
jgi:hypothetical protein